MQLISMDKLRTIEWALEAGARTLGEDMYGGELIGAVRLDFLHTIATLAYNAGQDFEKEAAALTLEQAANEARLSKRGFDPGTQSNQILAAAYDAAAFAIRTRLD